MAARIVLRTGVSARGAPAPGVIHLMMRFNDKLFGIGSVIERHAAVVTQRGAVWLAKIGRPLGSPRVEQINAQIRQAKPTYLFLSQRRGEVWRSAIVEVRSKPPPGAEALVPDYYHEFDVFLSAETWFNVKSFERLDQTELDGIRTVSSGQPIMWTMSTSMASLFIVRELDTSRRTP